MGFYPKFKEGSKSPQLFVDVKSIEQRQEQLRKWRQKWFDIYYDFYKVTFWMIYPLALFLGFLIQGIQAMRWAIYFILFWVGYHILQWILMDVIPFRFFEKIYFKLKYKKPKDMRR